MKAELKWVRLLSEDLAVSVSALVAPPGQDLHDLGRLFHTSGRCAGSERESHGQPALVLWDGMSWQGILTGLFFKLGMRQWQEIRSHPTSTSTWNIHQIFQKKSGTLSVQHHDISLRHNPDCPLAPASQPTPGPALFQNGTQQKSRLYFPSYFPPAALRPLSDPGEGTGKGYEIRIPSLTV